MGRVIIWQVTTGTTPAKTSDNLLGWVLAFALALVVLFLVAQPLLFAPATASTKRNRAQADETARQELEELQEKAAAENKSLEELEFDKELGIIEEADYTALKEQSQVKLNQLENAIASRQERIAEAQRERQTRIAARRAAKAVQNGGGSTAVAEAPDAIADPDTGDIVNTESESVYKWKMVKVDLHCSECETEFKPGDKFCSNCRAPLPLLCRRCHAELEPNDKFCSNCGMATKA